jgi:hypothetical protein
LCIQIYLLRETLAVEVTEFITQVSVHIHMVLFITYPIDGKGNCRKLKIMDNDKCMLNFLNDEKKSSILSFVSSWPSFIFVQNKCDMWYDIISGGSWEGACWNQLPCLTLRFSSYFQARIDLTVISNPTVREGCDLYCYSVK